MKVRWIVELSETERDELEELISSGTLGARVMKRALILLRSDDGWTAEQVSDALSVVLRGSQDDPSGLISTQAT